MDLHDNSAGEERAVMLYARSATRLSNGMVVVVDQYARALHWFDANGTTVRVVGRQGSGPGEFADPRWVGQCAPDTLFVWDYGQRMMTVVDSAGQFIRRFRPQGSPHAIGCSSTGVVGVLGIPSTIPSPSADAPNVPAPLWIANTEGDSTRWIGAVPFGENRPLGRLTQVAVAHDRLYVGTAESATVDVYGLNGERLRQLPVHVERRTPTRANYERSIELMVSVISNTSIRERFRRTYSAIPPPSHVPPYTDLLVDSTGVLWAVVSTPGDASTQLHAIASDGRLIAVLDIPVNLSVFEIGIDYVLGSYTDTNGFQHVMLYRLHRS